MTGPRPPEPQRDVPPSPMPPSEPLREPDPDRLPDEEPEPNPDEQDEPPHYVSDDRAWNNCTDLLLAGHTIEIQEI